MPQNDGQTSQKPFSIKEAAARLGISYAVVRERVQSTDQPWPHFRLGRSTRIPVWAVELLQRGGEELLAASVAAQKAGTVDGGSAEGRVAGHGVALTKSGTGDTHGHQDTA